MRKIDFDILGGEEGDGYVDISVHIETDESVSQHIFSLYSMDEYDMLIETLQNTREKVEKLFENNE